ncbi:MAG: hypothetical protein ABEJ36_02975 [Candidatus Nanosalina sp.]
MNSRKLSKKIVLNGLNLVKTSLEFVRNLILPLVLFTLSFIFAHYFQEYYLQKTALENFFHYIIGYWAGVFPIASFIYIGYMNESKPPPETEKIFTSKLSASIIGSTVVVSGIRVIPPFLSRFGVPIKSSIISGVVLNLIYLLPIILIFILYRNFTIHGDISRNHKIKRKFEERVEELQETYQDIDWEEEDTENILENEDSEKNSRIIPEIDLGLEKGEVKDGIINGNLMIIILGITTYLVEKYLIYWKITDLLILVILLIPVLKYGVSVIQSLISELSSRKPE